MGLELNDEGDDTDRQILDGKWGISSIEMVSISEKMRTEWNERAKSDALYFIESSYDTSDVDRFFEIGEQKATEIIDPILEDWDRYPPSEEPMVALDIGCGVGRITRSLAKRFDNVIGIDVSDEMIRHARSLNSDFDNIEFYSTDGVSFNPVSESSVDFVFSYEVLQHVPNREIIEQNVSDISRVLATDGLSHIHFRPPYSSEKLFDAVDVPYMLIEKIPEEIKRVYFSITHKKGGLVASNTWTGTSISPAELWSYFDKYGLDVVQFYPDTTHDVGQRLFCVAEA